MAELPNEEESRWDFDQLVNYISSEEGNQGNHERGRSVFAKANACSATVLAKRVKQWGRIDRDRKTILQTRNPRIDSLPSHIISDQYASKKVLTLDGESYTGMLSDSTDQTLQLRDSNNQVLVIEEANVDQILPSSSSIMPAGLLDESSLQEISDLMSTSEWFQVLKSLPNLKVSSVEAKASLCPSINLSEPTVF